MPWSSPPKPAAITVDPHIRARVLDLARDDRVRAVRLLREETGLPLRFSVVLVDSWLAEPAPPPEPASPSEPAPPSEPTPGAVGERLLDVVRVMDRLRSPGGCPWDAEQTHASLRGYLLEEAHEAYDAIVDDDPVAMREELGDVLLQVVFHARVAAEADPDRRFDIDDVAGDLVDKLVRRHPHVFGDAGPRDVAQVEAGWDEIKKAEKQRLSPTEGVSRSQPAAAWGAALVRRAARAGLSTPEPAELADASPEALGERLLAVVTAAEQRGWDVEDALREAVRRYAGELDAEAAAASADRPA
ncbi:MazG family protein [Blastococcus haudaquaticus]|uniref:XTP/dITP diphosphohydrolase n=1 Tax=Blastococcus haudaquaticus TaxID=1938745 RepID=A0A286H184_9ACTN|nr:MazG family protein [Blastococcus haudaquaticus]SOE01064.1 XTP/dITP diphosphohydrolase [Blastococcus haudaquaticus]